jgi:hypothetical protein
MALGRADSKLTVIVSTNSLSKSIMKESSSKIRMMMKIVIACSMARTSHSFASLYYTGVNLDAR